MVPDILHPDRRHVGGGFRRAHALVNSRPRPLLSNRRQGKSIYPTSQPTACFCPPAPRPPRIITHKPQHRLQLKELVINHPNSDPADEAVPQKPAAQYPQRWSIASPDPEAIGRTALRIVGFEPLFLTRSAATLRTVPLLANWPPRTPPQSLQCRPQPNAGPIRLRARPLFWARWPTAPCFVFQQIQ